MLIKITKYVYWKNFEYQTSSLKQTLSRSFFSTAVSLSKSRADTLLSSCISVLWTSSALYCRLRNSSMVRSCSLTETKVLTHPTRSTEARKAERMTSSQRKILDIGFAGLVLWIKFASIFLVVLLPEVNEMHLKKRK